jgi:hypothetical protein
MVMDTRYTFPPERTTGDTCERRELSSPHSPSNFATPRWPHERRSTVGFISLLEAWPVGCRCNATPDTNAKVVSFPLHDSLYWTGLVVFAPCHLLPVTGRPLLMSSSSITFHLPTCLCLSIGVCLPWWTVTLGKFSVFSCSDCHSLLGSGLILRPAWRPSMVVAFEITESRTRWPVNCCTRLRI